ncbi:MAG: hypothetical protein R3E48_16725 [Burkholderiaceae bacterium]
MAATVVTAVMFSATLTDALAPPPSEVMTGSLSLTGVTVTLMAWVSVLPEPVVDLTVTTLPKPTYSSDRCRGAQVAQHRHYQSIVEPGRRRAAARWFVPPPTSGGW